MHCTSFLHEWLKKSCPGMHLRRNRAVVKVVGALLGGGRLALTHLGRSIQNRAFVKHNIKCVDRLLGNQHLHGERMDIYRFVAKWLLEKMPHPVIVVDYSDCETGRGHVVLKAAVPLGGRAVSIYDEVHRLCEHGTDRAHKRFLRNLKSVLPESCRPIIVTYAGFRGPWFREVERLGWQWVGRVRMRLRILLDGEGTWSNVLDLYPKARRTPRYLGHGLLAKRSLLPCHFYLFRKYARKPGHQKRRHGLDTNEVRCRRRETEPWLIASSISPDEGGSTKVIRLYSLRMQIEETFRDLKSHRWGLGLQYARSRSVKRLEVLLLIGALATLVNWTMGLAAKANEWQKHFQANTEKSRTVLSACFLGRQLFQSSRFRITQHDAKAAERRLPTMLKEYVQWV